MVTHSANNKAGITPSKGLPVEKHLEEQFRANSSWPARVSTYLRKLFTFNFESYVIIQVVPVVYGLALLAGTVGIGYLCVEAFFHSVWRGLFCPFIAGPLSFFVLASVLRALLEFFRVMFPRAVDVDSLIGQPDSRGARHGL